MSEIEEIRKRYRDKHQQYNSPVRMWDDIQTLLDKMKELENETSYMESLTRAKMEAESEWTKTEVKTKGLEEDVFRLHEEKMKHWKRAEQAETERERLSKLLIKARIMCTNRPWDCLKDDEFYQELHKVLGGE